MSSALSLASASARTRATSASSSRAADACAGHARFLCGQLAQRLRFHLRLCLREPGFCGFLAKPLEVALESGFGFGAHAGDFGLERAGRSLVRSLPRRERCFVAALVGFALRFFLCAACLFGFLAQTIELGAQPRVGFGLHACDF